MRKSSGAFHLTDDRMKRAVSMLRGAEVAQSDMRLVGDAFQQRSRKPRFADARFAGEQNDLTFAALCSRPAPMQKFEFFFPPNECRQAGCVKRVKAALD
jgi:hypothetical protein